MSDLSWSTQERNIADLVAHKSNPRQLSEKQRADLTASLVKFNFVELPVINLDGTLLAGHQRLRIMKVLGRGEEDVEVRVPSRQLTDAEADEYLVRSNKNTGDWDFDKLASEFKLEDLVDWGFTEGELGMQSGDASPPEGFADPESGGDDNGVPEMDNKCPSCSYEWNGQSR